MNCRIQIFSEEHCRFVLSILFKNGIFWASGDARYIHLDCNWLCVRKTGITWGIGDPIDYRCESDAYSLPVKTLQELGLTTTMFVPKPKNFKIKQ